MLLLTTTPAPSSEDENSPSKFKSLYLRSKSHVASAEGLGLNSFLIIQARTLVTLFEVAHSLYPAAYISIRATLRAAEAHENLVSAHISPSESADDGPTREEEALTWCGILVLDRYIAIEPGAHIPLAQSRRTSLSHAHQLTIFSIQQLEQDQRSYVNRFIHLFEASSSIDQILAILYRPTAGSTVNMEELLATVQSSVNLQTALGGDTGAGRHICAGGLSLSHTALLLAFEHGAITLTSKDSCKAIATKSLHSILSSITDSLEYFSLGKRSIDFNTLPPFVAMLSYKAAAIITQRMLGYNDSLEEGLRKLRILRSFLRMVGERWLSGKRYLELLNEDTTPRILKALEQG